MKKLIVGLLSVCITFLVAFVGEIFPEVQEYILGNETVIEGLIDGTLDAIATDHAPHHRDEKELEFDQASNGIVGLETSLALGVTYLVKTGKLTMSQLIEKMSVNPAEIIGFDRGSLAEGKVADVVIFDAEEEFTVHVNDFASKGKNSPYDGFTLTGQVETTITGGKIVYQRA